MDRLHGQRWSRRPGVFVALWIVALGATWALAPGWFRKRVGDTARMVAALLWQAWWTWPLAAVAAGAVLDAVLSRGHARDRWDQRWRGLGLGLAVFAGLVGLIGVATAVGPRWVLVALVVAAGAGLLFVGVVVIPRRRAPVPSPAVLDGMSQSQRLEAEGSRLKLQNDLGTTVLQVVAGLAVLAGAFLGFQQLTEDRQQAAADRALARQSQAGERFTRAVDQLGSSRQDVQLGGIYGLGQIARQDSESRLPVTQVLVGYLRRHTSGPIRPPTNPPAALGVRAPDVQAVLTVLGQPGTAAAASGLDLGRLDLNGANLTGANLPNADLTEANLTDTNLTDAFLNGANFTGAFLHGVNLTGASIAGARFGQAELIEADLTRANLRGANLANMRLTGAKLTGADLTGADLTGADLTGADLREADLTGAVADQATSWPAGFNPRTHGVHLDDRGTQP